jgi:outer membrane protein assembly factor BamB
MIAVLGIAILTFLISAAAGDETAPSGWHQFRGPLRDGKSAETGLARGWGPTGPKELWRVPIGAGFSSVSIASGRLFTMDADGETEFALALDAATGHTLWRAPIGPIFHDVNGDGPRSTPTVDSDRVFVLGSRGRLAALRAETGETMWETSFTDAFEGELPTWAFATAPLVDGDRLLVEVGGSGPRAIAAFDKKTGAVVWTSQEAHLAYSSPVSLEHGGTRQFLFLLQEKLVSLDRDGRELWSVPFAPQLDIKPASPVFVAPDLVLISASYDVGAKVVRLKTDGAEVSAEELWSGRQMRSHFGSAVALVGRIYGFDTATLRCLDAETGESCWAKRRLGKGSLIYADGMFLVLSERGMLVLLEATPEAYRELASHQVLEGRCWTPPSLSEGRLYLRNHSELVALDLRS